MGPGVQREYRVYRTDFPEGSSSVFLEDATFLSCGSAASPSCKHGYSCTDNGHSLSCLKCPQDKPVSGGHEACKSCPGNQGPTANYSTCVPCVGTKINGVSVQQVGIYGRCTQCPYGVQLREGGAFCMCKPGQQSSAHKAETGTSACLSFHIQKRGEGGVSCVHKPHQYTHYVQSVSNLEVKKQFV